MKRLEPKRHRFRNEKASSVRVIDLEGESCRPVAFSRADKSEWLSSGRSIDSARQDLPNDW